jgi:hypothetical protein
MPVDVYAGKSDGWHRLNDAAGSGTTPVTPPDLTGYTMLTTPGANARTTIQNALDSHGKVGLTDVALGGAANWDCTSSLLLDSNMELYVGNGVNLWRNFNSTAATSSGFIKNRSFSAAIAHNKIWGPGNIAARNGMGGNILSLWANSLLTSGWSTSYYKRHTMIAGNDIIMQDHVWRVDMAAGSGGAGLRFAGGNNFLGQRLNVVSGDDVFQFVPAGATNDPLWNIANCTSGKYVDCVGRSLTGRVIAVGLQDSNTGGSVALGMHVSCTDLLFQRVQGYGGGSAINVANHSSTGSIQRVYFDAVTVDQRLTQDATHGQPGECFVQVEATSSTPTMGPVNDVDFAGSGGHGYSGATVLNKRAAKDLLHITDPQSKVSNVTTPHTAGGSLSLVLP